MKKTDYTLYIKNMVCPRCIMVVTNQAQETDLELESVALGVVKLMKEPTKDQLAAFKMNLEKNGFELIDDNKSMLLERIKTLVIDTIHHNDQFELTLNWSHYISDKLGYDYQYLSSLFSSVSGVTLEHYIINQKIEKAKEYLFYDELSVKEIAFKLGYSSVAHLSTQFKKVTGFTPTQFKESRETVSRRSIDQI